MTDIGLQILIIFLLLILNGVFAMSEIALISAKKVKLQKKADGGDRNAKAALELAASPNRLLSTVQIGISLVGVFSGALGGATLADEMAVLLSYIAFLEPYSQVLGFIIVSLLITYFSLVIGELVPKRLALNSPERMARLIARPMRFLSRMTAPVVRFLSASTNLVLKLMGVKPRPGDAVTEEEILVYLEEGTQRGIFEEAEQDIVESVFRMGDRRADAIMTPHTELIWIDLEKPYEVVRQMIIDSPYARVPVASERLDNILGVLQVKDFLIASLEDEPVDIKALLEPALYVPESMPAFKVLDLLKQHSATNALVIDEYGGTLGMITLIDLLESIVGDIPSPIEPEPEIIQREDGSWLMDGLLQIDELLEELEIDGLPGQDVGGYQTLGGFIMNWLGEIPESGQFFEIKGFRFEVVDMDGRRVDKVLVEPVISDPLEEIETEA
jgi:putative hemolysin